VSVGTSVLISGLLGEPRRKPGGRVTEPAA
jgi:hypothetical protein